MKKAQDLGAAQLLPHYHLAGSPNRVDLEYVLRQIKSDDSDLSHIDAP